MKRFRWVLLAIVAGLVAGPAWSGEKPVVKTKVIVHELGDEGEVGHDGEVIEKKVLVIRDENGETRVLTGEDAEGLAAEALALVGEGEGGDVRREVFVWKGDDGSEHVIRGGDEEMVFFSPTGEEAFEHFVVAAGGGYLGVQLLDTTEELLAFFEVPDKRGVLVSRVMDDSPAEAAGVRVGDVVTSVDGKEVGSSFELSRVVRGHEAGETLDIELWRKGKVKKVRAELVERQGAATLGNRRIEIMKMIDEDGEKDAEIRLRRMFGGPGGSVHFGPTVERTRELEMKLRVLEKKLQELTEKLEKVAESD